MDIQLVAEKLSFMFTNISPFTTPPSDLKLSTKILSLLTLRSNQYRKEGRHEDG